MRLLRMIRFYLQLTKALIRVIFFLSKKCRRQLICNLIVISVIYIYFGLLLAFVSTIASILYIVYNFCDHLLYSPNEPHDSRTNVLSPMVFNLPFESIFITTEDNVKINALLIKRPELEYKLSPTMIYFHGNAGNIGHRLQNVYELYHEIGCNVLLVEYRGYGLSEGQPSEKGLYRDACAALDYVIRRPDLDSSKVLVFGRSLGGAVAIDLAKNSPNRSHIAALIVENTFTSIPDIGRTLFNCRIIRFLPNWYYKNQFNSMAKVSAITAPVLFMSGLSDELIPSPMMTSLYSLCSSPVKQLHRLESGSHNFTWKCRNYYHIIRLFLAQVLPKDIKDIKESHESTTPSSSTTMRTGLVPQTNQSLITFEDIERQSNKSFNI